MKINFSHVRTVLVSSICVVLAACAQTPDTPLRTPQSSTGTRKPLAGEEIRSRIAGRTFHWLRARDQAAGQTRFAADGAMSWKRSDVKSNGTGKWWIDGDKLCQQYAPTPIWKGGLVCRTLTPSGSNLVTSHNDGGLVTFTEVSG